MGDHGFTNTAAGPESKAAGDESKETPTRPHPAYGRDETTQPPGEIRLRFLGSGDNFGSGGRFQSCIHVETGGTRFLMDCGASSLIPMKRSGVSTAEIDLILISHLHGDHFSGIPFFILDAQLVSRRETPLFIAGPPGLEQRTCDAMEALYRGSSRVERKFVVRYIEMAEGETTQVCGLAIRPLQVVHGSGAPPYGLRIECAGKIIAYSGDTEWTDALLPLAADADLFICECSFFDKPVKYHISYRSLVAHLAELRCRRIILTHMGDDMLARRGQIELETAYDGLEVIL